MRLSWSRLLSGTAARPRDPLVGRSALAGLLAGSGLSLLAPLGHALRSVTEGVPAPPEIGNWTMLISGHDALADIVQVLGDQVASSSFLALTLVLARLVTRRQGLAIPLVLLVGLALDTGPPDETSPAAIVRLAIKAATTLVLIAVLLRFGLLSLVVASFVGTLAPLAATPNLSAWHGQPAFLVLACVAALAAYGCWAATAGRGLFRAEAG